MPCRIYHVHDSDDARETLLRFAVARLKRSHGRSRVRHSNELAEKSRRATSAVMDALTNCGQHCQCTALTLVLSLLRAELRLDQKADITDRLGLP